MASKTVYTTTTTCDICGKEKHKESGNTGNRSGGFLYSNNDLFFGHTFPFGEYDFCKECEDNFQKWKVDRIAAQKVLQDQINKVEVKGGIVDNYKKFTSSENI